MTEFKVLTETKACAGTTSQVHRDSDLQLAQLKYLSLTSLSPFLPKWTRCQHVYVCTFPTMLVAKSLRCKDRDLKLLVVIIQLPTPWRKRFFVPAQKNIGANILSWGNDALAV